MVTDWKTGLKLSILFLKIKNNMEAVGDLKLAFTLIATTKGPSKLGK
jgi:hypothetical protein